MSSAIDYTLSNKGQDLHTMSNPQGNQYEQAIMRVGEILEPYDYDRMFGVFGFGGIPRYLGFAQVSHCWALNGNPGNPQVPGAQGILAKYRETLPQIELYGPTIFSEIIGQFVQMVRAQGQVTIYHVLLIMTDGAIVAQDMKKTKDMICQAAHLPCSIIIVGVGNSPELAQMEDLDGDDDPLVDINGKKCVRDIVQFVKFNDCVARGNLGEEVLKELPDQVCQFMEMVGYQPQPIQVNPNVYHVQMASAQQIAGHLITGALQEHTKGAISGLLQNANNAAQETQEAKE